MTRKEQTALILKNGFRYKGSKMTWFKILTSNDTEYKKGNTFWVDALPGKKATKAMYFILNQWRERYPQENLEIVFAGVYDPKSDGAIVVD